MSSESAKNWTQWSPATLAGALVGLSPLAFSTRVENGFGLPRLLLLMLAAALSLGCLIGWLHAAPSRWRRAWLAATAPAWAWLAWAVLVTASRQPDATALVAVMVTAMAAAPFLAFASGLSAPAATRTILTIAVAVAGVQAAYALLQWGGFDPLFAHATHQLAGAQATQRIIGTIGYQNTLGEYLALLLPVALWLGGSARHHRRHRIWFAFAALMFLAILLTRSRGATVAALLGVATWLALSTRLEGKRLASRPALACAGVALGLTLLALALTHREGPFALHQRLRDAVHPRSPALLQRALVWRVTASMFPDHLAFGQGLGAVSRHYLDHLGTLLSQPAHAHLRPFALNVKESHNDYLQMLAELGAVGLALWLLVLLTAWRRLALPSLCASAGDSSPSVSTSIRTGQPAPAPETAPESGLRAAVAGSTVAFMAAGLVSFPLHVLPVAPLYWLLLGLGIAPVAAIAPNSLSSIAARRSLALLVPLLAAGAVVLYGDHCFLQGRAAMQAGHFPEARHAYARAQALLPLNARLRFFHGTAQLADGQPAEACQSFAAAAAGGFADLNLWRNWARACLALDRPDDAVALLRRAAATELLPDEVYPELAGALIRAGNPQVALAALQRMPRYATATEDAACVVAREMLAVNQIEPALAFLTPYATAAHSVPAERAAVLETLGAARLMQGDHARAEAHLRDALNLAPDNLSARNNLGAALRLQGRHAEAIAAWQAVLHQDPTNPTAHRNLRE